MSDTKPHPYSYILLKAVALEIAMHADLCGTTLLVDMERLYATADYLRSLEARLAKYEAKPNAKELQRAYEAWIKEDCDGAPRWIRISDAKGHDVALLVKAAFFAGVFSFERDAAGTE